MKDDGLTKDLIVKKAPHILAVERLYWWQHGGTNFTSLLYDLIAKADNENKERIRLAFPHEVKAYLEWFNMPSAEDFYKKYNLGVKSEN